MYRRNFLLRSTSIWVVISKNAMTEFFSNLSMEALSKSNNNILLSFTQIENLEFNINGLLRTKIDYLNEINIKAKKRINEMLTGKKLITIKHFTN